ncbi:MAG: Flp pilus assembly protein CpaB [Chloroflexi bacterium]|nr:MAG: Flp pilus assembly protein CpaB [Chloroflexota bacterium]
MKSSTIWWIGAIVLAILAGAITYQMLSTAAPPSLSSDDPGAAPVVVAARDIPFRRSIGEEEVEIKYYPLDAVPPGAASTIEQVVGKMSASRLFAGEPIIVDDLITPDIVTQQLALSVPEGKVVMAVPVESMLLTNRLVQPGDRIDILGSFELEPDDKTQRRQRSESIVALQNVEVHAIIVRGLDNEDSARRSEQNGRFASLNPEEQAVLLALDVQDALLLRHILDVGGTLDIVLRAPDDNSLAQAVPVDVDYLLTRYQITPGSSSVAALAARAANGNADIAQTEGTSP